MSKLFRTALIFLLGLSAAFSQTYGLSSDLDLEETGSFAETPQNAFWWLSSGGYFHVKNGIGSTNVGELPENDKC